LFPPSPFLTEREEEEKRKKEKKEKKVKKHVSVFLFL